MSAIYDTNRLLFWIGEKNLNGNLKRHLWRSLNVGKFFKRFNFFTGTFKEFYRKKAHLSVRLAWNLYLFFVAIIFLGRNTPGNKFVDITNKETNKVMWHRC